MTRIETALRRATDGATFVVRTDDDAFRAVLPRLGFAAHEGAFVRTFAAPGPDLDRIYARFARHITAVLEQAAGVRPAPWGSALVELAGRLQGVEWFLVGSAGLAVRGIDVAPRDVDLVALDHTQVARALDDALVEPPARDADRRWVAEWFGRAFVGSRVEWVAGVYPERAATPEELRGAGAGRCEHVHWQGLSLRVAPLEAHLTVAESRGLEDRVEAIQRFMRHNRTSGAR